MDRVRLLIFLNCAVRGGVEEVAIALAKGLENRGFEVHLAAPMPLLESFAAELAATTVRTFPIELVSLRQWGEMRAFVGYLRRHRIQIANPHRFYATLFAAPLAWLSGVPVVIETTHGPEAWRTSWWKRRYWVDRVIERFVTANVAVSEANRRFLAGEKRYPPQKLNVVPNGRELSCYAAVSREEVARIRERFGIAEFGRVLVVVARLDAQKGHTHLLAALPDVLKEFPDLRTILVGDGALRPELERKVAALGLERCVSFGGFQTDVAPYYALADFAVLPSLYEGMPLSAIEAGAAGRAMVATGVDGTAEVIVDGETGVLVRPASPAALAEGILRLLRAPAEAAAMGRAARARVASLFSLERQIERTGRLYGEILAKEGVA